MIERRKVVAIWKSGNAGTLVSLVRVEGSSYRRPGARLLTEVDSPGYAGTISGGCLEAEVVRRASWIAREGAVVERYAMSFDNTADIPFGLGCGGTVDLLFESPARPEGRALMQAMEASLEGREARVVTFLPGGGRSLRRIILDASGKVIFASDDVSAEKIDCARGLQPGNIYEGRFVEHLGVPKRLFVFGAGDDVKPVVEIAALLGWSVVVADSRAHLAQRKRFPKAERVVVTNGCDFDTRIGARDSVVLMTHSYEQDGKLLTEILPKKPRYLGMLGSRHRSSLLVGEAAARLSWTVEACCENIFAPVGLDTGGDGPEAIALAIVAEVQSVGEGRIGSQRRLKADEVVQQIEAGGASLYLQTQCALSA